MPNYQRIAWEPRFGFAWQPLGAGNTVIRGGIGIFADVFPGTIATAFDTNSPLKNTFVASGLQLAPGLPGSAQTATTASNAAFLAGFNSGLNIGQIEAGSGGALFSPPTFTNAANSIHYPTYQEWNLEIQQPLGSKMSISLNYVGNHGTCHRKNGRNANVTLSSASGSGHNQPGAHSRFNRPTPQGHV